MPYRQCTPPVGRGAFRGIEMIYRVKASRSRGLPALYTMFLAALLAGCGGGGGSDGSGFLPDDGSSDPVAYNLSLALLDSIGNPTSTVTITQPATLQVTVVENVEPRPPVSGTVVTAASGFGVIEPENGQALTNGDGVAQFTIRAGDTLGADTVEISVNSPAGPVTASISYEIQPGGLQLGAFTGTSFAAGVLNLNANEIASGGTALVRFAVTDEFGEAVDTVSSVRFESSCTLSGNASLRLVGGTEESSRLTVETVEGLGSLEYVAGTCEGEDVLRGRLLENGTSASATLTVAPALANFIGFFRANPSEGLEAVDRTILALKDTGTAGRTEIATVTFEVLQDRVILADGDPGPGDPAYLENPSRRPLTGARVEFALTNTLGDIRLLNTFDVSDGNGLVEVQVQSGNVATSTRVTATFERADGTGDLSTTSNQIVVGTGLADQNSISLSAETLNVPLAAEIDGIGVALTVRMADRFNNPVADGTNATFTTEYGAVDDSCVTGVSNGDRFRQIRGDTAPTRGTCSVLWISQAPRFPLFNNNLIKRTDGRSETINDSGNVLNWRYNCPDHRVDGGPCPSDLGAIRALRSTVLVTAIGEESFVDLNGNGLYDEGEPFENLPEAFIDHNEDGVYTPVRGPNCGLPTTRGDCEAAGAEEEFIDFNGDGLYSLNDASGGVYNGSLCPTAGDGVFCSRELLNVRDDIVITLSSSAINQQALLVNMGSTPQNPQANADEGVSMRIYLADIFNNPPGAGTTISVEAEGDDCEIITPETFTVPEIGSGRGAYAIPLAVSGAGSETSTALTTTGRVNLTLSDPEGQAVRVASYACRTRCDAPERDEDGTQTGCNE